MSNEDNSGTVKRVHLCECTSFSFVSADTVSLEFVWPGPTPKSGQFFLIKPNRTRVFLSRPINVAGFRCRKSMSSSINALPRLIENRSGDGDRRKTVNPRIIFDRRINPDRRLDDGGYLQFLVTRRGKGSRDIVDIRPGEEAELIGPLGNCWPLDDIPPDYYKGKHVAGPVALVGAEVGIAPLLALATELGKKTYDFYAGFRNVSYGLDSIKPKAHIIATDDGSLGVKGPIQDYFTPKGYCRVFACGPEPMLKAVADVCIAGGVPCFISIEKQMACGVGACLSCKVHTIKGARRCCTDGPIFNAEEICFEE